MKRLGLVLLLVAACGGKSAAPVGPAWPPARDAPPDADWWCYDDTSANLTECEPVEADCTAAAAEAEVTCEVRAEAWCILKSSETGEEHECVATEENCQRIFEVTSALDENPTACVRTD